MTHVVVLGGSGMLGSMLVDVLELEPGLEITATVRDKKTAEWGKQQLQTVRWEVFDVERGDLRALLAGQEWVINAIGITKPYIRETDPDTVRRAINTNSLFPYRLAEAAAEVRARVLQIATDCTYSGHRGKYVEADPHDALDAYGRTKSLGEVNAPHFHNLRCSIIGPEPLRRAFLLEWLRSQASAAEISGYTSHLWNGLSTLHFSRICGGIITKNVLVPNLQHIVPRGDVNKAELLEALSSAYSRTDLTIAHQRPEAVDRTLSTNAPNINCSLWRSAGYPEPPTIRTMVEEVARHDFRLGRPS